MNPVANMVHADHQAPSFLLSPQLPSSSNLFHIDPPTEAEVFAYLDAHPDALQRYLMRAPGAMELLSPTFAQGAPLPQAASENKAQPTAVGPTFFDDFTEGFEDVVGQAVGDAEQAVGGWEFLDSLSDGELLFGTEVPQAGPEVLSDNHSFFNIGGEDVAGDVNFFFAVGGGAVDTNEALQAGSAELSEADGTTTAIKNDDGSETASATNNAANDATPVASSDAAEVDSDLIPYPAPAHLIDASRAQPPTRSWALWEEDSCIRHMIDINNEDQIHGEARFREALSRMRVHDGCQRTGPSAVKNFWNRIGRARSRLDERRKKSAPLATSKQGKKAQNSRSTTTASSSHPTKQRKTNSSFPATKSRSTTARRQNTPTTSDKEDEESEFIPESESEEPQHTRTPRKRKDSSDDGSEGGRAPDFATVNAVAKGLRPPKRARTAAAC